jgi:diguanylate cyclase (GGDEF)-like protein
MSIEGLIPGQGGDQSALSYGGREAVPRRAIFLCAAALSVPMVVTLLGPLRPEGLEPLIWLVSLVPVFLLAYYRGWRGAALAALAGLVVLITTQGGLLLLMDDAPPQWVALVAIAAVYLAVCAAAGSLAESLHRSRERAEALALTDELTGIPNRRHVCLVLDHDFAAAQRGRPLTVALFDLDRFKLYNDQHGHAAGDRALRLFARMLNDATRRMNRSGRYGGEEFLAVLSETDVESSMIFVERVRRQARSLDLPAGAISVSVGIAAYYPEMETPEDLVAAADGALYQAKSLGGNEVCVAAPPRVTARAASSQPA